MNVAGGTSLWRTRDARWAIPRASTSRASVSASGALAARSSTSMTGAALRPSDRASSAPAARKPSPRWKAAVACSMAANSAAARQVSSSVRSMARASTSRSRAEPPCWAACRAACRARPDSVSTAAATSPIMIVSVLAESVVHNCSSVTCTPGRLRWTSTIGPVPPMHGRQRMLSPPCRHVGLIEHRLEAERPQGFDC